MSIYAILTSCLLENLKLKPLDTVNTLDSSRRISYACFKTRTLPILYQSLPNILLLLFVLLLAIFCASSFEEASTQKHCSLICSTATQYFVLCISFFIYLFPLLVWPAAPAAACVSFFPTMSITATIVCGHDITIVSVKLTILVIKRRTIHQSYCTTTWINTTLQTLLLTC